jgi:hypothetical protein
MSAQDPRPAPRRRKLVLRKIADGAAPAPVAAAPSSTQGSVSTMRSPPQSGSVIRSPLREAPAARPKPALMLPLESDPSLTEPHSEPGLAEAEEAEPVDASALVESEEGVEREVWPSAATEDWRTSEAEAAIAAMTPAINRAAAAVPEWRPMPTQSAQSSIPFAPPRAVAPGPSRESVPRPSVAPVVSTLPPIGAAPDLGARPRGRLSADSKLLAAGGALAAAMLLVALGVLLGQRSAGTGSPSAAASGPFPVVVETRAAAPAAVPIAPAALPVETRPAVPAPVAVRVEAPTAIDVQQLAPAPPPRAQGWSVAAATPKEAPAGAAATGWTVASPPARRATPTPVAAAHLDPALAAQSPAAPDDKAPPATSAAAVTPETSAAAPSAPPPVDPFVQAVRDDIREDESRTHTR